MFAIPLLTKKTPYRVERRYQNGSAHNIVRAVQKEKYVDAPTAFNRLDDWTKSEGAVAPTEWMHRNFIMLDPNFWKGKNILDLGCAHDIIAKILLDTHKNDFSYTGLDLTSIDYKYPADTQHKQNVRFIGNKNINDIVETDFVANFDVLLYFGVSIQNLKGASKHLKPNSHLIYSTSDYCWDLDTHEIIKKEGFRLEQQVWLVGRYNFPDRINEAPERQSFEFADGYLIYAKKAR
jgi:2-polyprenyl-3-methyl-5-hydroxy-6-metoxy-1,4-benzoquinol methylase